MFRGLVFAGLFALAPSFAMAQQPCTTDARHVVDELYRHMLERSADAGAQGWADRLNSGTTVREIVRQIAQSPEHMQRFFNASEGATANQNAVGTLYRHILGRQPDAAGLQTMTDLANRQGRAAVVDTIINSPEYTRTFGDWGVPGSGGVTFCGSGTSTASSVSNPEMRFADLDRNHNGQIERSEWRGGPRSFAIHDWNNDGVLSGEEVSVNGVRRGNARNDEVQNEDRFDYLDVNGNGFIDRNEWDGGRYVFDRLDSNRDNKLNRDEWDTVGRSSNNFATLDANRDGRITLNEWPWTHRAFDDQDTNRDGVLSRQEFQGSPATRRN